MKTHDTVRDELEIRNLIATIAHCADSDEDLSRYLGCFTEDAVWDLRIAPAGQPVASGARRGLDAIRSGALERRRVGMQGPGSGTLHVITTTALQIEGDQARARSYFIFMSDIGNAPKAAVVGIYTDGFLRAAQGWRLCERVVTSN